MSNSTEGTVILLEQHESYCINLKSVPSGVPQGTKLWSTLVILMTRNLDTNISYLWKFIGHIHLHPKFYSMKVLVKPKTYSTVSRSGQKKKVSNYILIKIENNVFQKPNCFRPTDRQWEENPKR